MPALDTNILVRYIVQDDAAQLAAANRRIRRCVSERLTLFVPITVIRGSGGVRKVRWSRLGTGKSGGVRVVYLLRTEQGEVFLLTMYAKSVKENIPLAVLKEIRRALEV